MVLLLIFVNARTSHDGILFGEEKITGLKPGFGVSLLLPPLLLQLVLLLEPEKEENCGDDKASGVWCSRPQ